MTHPYAEFEDGSVWHFLNDALAELEQNGDVTVTTARTHVIGRMCQALRPLVGQQYSRTDVSVWRALCKAKWPKQANDVERLNIAHEIVPIARVGTAEHVLQYLANQTRHGAVTASAGPMSGPLARHIVAIVENETLDDTARAF